MSTDNTEKAQFGSISIGGNVGGNVDVKQAGGDIVGGDKVTTTTTTMTYGFKQEADKATFVQQLEDLRVLLREMKAGIEGAEGLDADQKDEAAMAVLQLVNDLKTVKDEAHATPAGKEAPKDKKVAVADRLDKTNAFLEKLKKLGETSAAIGQKVGPLLVKALPLLASARHLFGLP